MPSLECLILADDLTGACDAAAPFAARGLPVTVALSAEASIAGARVIALSTESRDAEPGEIPRRIAAAAAPFVSVRPRYLFKKIDSTLRGLAGVEIAAALDVFGCAAALVCPAFPAMNRTVEAGWLRVAGASAFAPIDIVSYLRLQGVERCGYAPAGSIAAALASGIRILVLDAVCDADLDGIAAAGAAPACPILWAGSAGLASALARSLPTGGLAPAHVRPAGPVLFCIGSDHPATLAQQPALLARAVQVQTREEVLSALAGGRHALLRVPRGRFTPETLWPMIAGVPARAVALSGGDTASLVCRAAGGCAIELEGEILPGVPWGVLCGGAWDGLAVATKSGGFGGEDALMQIADFFTCPNP